jgi:1-hydroxycarotenoid 3,4-desaturase
MSRLKTASAIVVGAGVGGLGAAALLAASGYDVTLLERTTEPGGKIRTLDVGGRAIDAGPTVCTMRWVFDELFAQAGARLEDYLSVTPARTLARHAWDDGSRLDLHADIDETVDAIGRFAGAADARGYRAFCERSRRIHDALERPFMNAPRTNVAGLVWRAGLAGLPALARISPFKGLWPALGRHFADPRLRQLFGRYATYCGSSPFLAPATLMLVAHVERSGVWLVDGGMMAVAGALAALARRQGARLRFGADVAEILVDAGGASGVRLAGGECLYADVVVFNGDVAALADGSLGPAAARGLEAHARRWRQPQQRSLSALTWSVLARSTGFPLARHNVFFSQDYRAEFDDLVTRRRLPGDPTVYVCAQDRDDASACSVDGERLLCLVNAPAQADRHWLTDKEIAACETSAFGRLQRCGLRREPLAPMRRTTPEHFAQRFPSTGGALYGPASHGWRASFQRLGSRHPLPGLYLAGGSTHPGPGVPMATLSGRLAAAAVEQDRASMRRLHTMATPGGLSMR